MNNTVQLWWDSLTELDKKKYSGVRNLDCLKDDDIEQIYSINVLKINLGVNSSKNYLSALIYLNSKGITGQQARTQALWMTKWAIEIAPIDIVQKLVEFARIKKPIEGVILGNKTHTDVINDADEWLKENR